MGGGKGVVKFIGGKGEMELLGIRWFIMEGNNGIDSINRSCWINRML